MNKNLPKLLTLLCFVLLLQSKVYSQTGTWSQLTNSAPDPNGGVMILLTDGTVMCLTETDPTNSGYGDTWDLLTPDSHGSYANGTWTTLPMMHDTRLYCATEVLPNGNVYVAGGEYGTGAATGEYYNTVTQTWTMATGVPGGWSIIDGNSEILYNGTVLQGAQIPSGSNNIIWTSSTNAYTSANPCFGSHDEASWVKLPDSSIMNVDLLTTNSERYIPQTGNWIHDGTLPVSLYDGSLGEAGPGFLLPNGKLFMLGDVQYTAYYTPTGHPTAGTWASGPAMPTVAGSGQLGCPDAPGAMMPNGKILCVFSHASTYNDTSWYYEFDYLTNTFTAINNPTGSGGLVGVPAYGTNALVLPDGTVLFSIQGANQYFQYTPGTGPIAAGKPVINSIIRDACPSYKLTGKLFNGITEGAGYGDDWQATTNYPIVRLSNGTNVYYAKTTFWNRVGAVKTDSLEDTVIFTPPASLPAGTYSLVVVANGNPSNPTIFKTLGVTMASHANILCNGGTGSATANAATGGIAPYTYNWTPSGGTNLTASNLSAGTYTITVHDNNGCSATASVSITQPATLTANITAFANVNCNGINNGFITLTAGGGTIPYTYSWAPSGGSAATASNLSAGTYTVTLTDKNGCSATASKTITQPATVLAVTISGHTDVTGCYGAKIGSATANAATGGTSPYTYNWTPSGGTNLTASSLSGGTYTITAKDNHGCTATASVTITQPAGMVITQDSINQSSAVCNGEAWVTVTGGGKTPYTYSWNPGGATTDTIKNLCANSYCCTVTDNNGCAQTICVTVKNTTAIGSIKNASSVNIYPDPNTGYFTVEGIIRGQRIEMYDYLGQKFNTVIADNTTVHFDISNKANGVYLVRILNTDGSIAVQKKIVKIQ